MNFECSDLHVTCLWVSSWCGAGARLYTTLSFPGAPFSSQTLCWLCAETVDLNVVIEAQSCSKVVLGTVLRPARGMLRSCGHPGATKVPSGLLFGLSLKGGRSFLTHHETNKLEKPRKSMGEACSCTSVQRSVAGCCRQGQGLPISQLLVLCRQPGSCAADRAWVLSRLY